MLADLNSHRLRTGRFSEPGRIYLLTAVTHQRHRFFLDWRIGRLLVAELMCQVKSRSSLSVNRALGRSGRLWQRNYHDRALREEEDVRHLARYTVANPLRAGLVKRLGDYPLWDAMWL